MGAKMNRFSEDIDLTYDIRELVPDLVQGGNPIPVTASQEKKITSAVRSRLPEWIAGSAKLRSNWLRQACQTPYPCTRKRMPKSTSMYCASA